MVDTHVLMGAIGAMIDSLDEGTPQGHVTRGIMSSDSISCRSGGIDDSVDSTKAEQFNDEIPQVSCTLLSVTVVISSPSGSEYNSKMCSHNAFVHIGSWMKNSSGKAHHGTFHVHQHFVDSADDWTALIA